jgi:hypothetical protein
LRESACTQASFPPGSPPFTGGFPLLAGAGVFYPLNLILFGLLPSYVALNLSILLILIIAAVGMFLYAREIETGVAAALVAAVSFAYSGFMISHLKHDGIVGAVCLFPLGLYLIERSIKAGESGNRSSRLKLLILLAIVFGFQNLSGHIQTAYYSGLVYGVYFLARMLRRPAKGAARGWRQRLDMPLLLWFSGALIIGAGISAIQLIPTYELVSLSQRSGGASFKFAADYAYDIRNWTMFFSPYANGDIGNATYRGTSVFWEDYGYVGIVTLLLAGIGAVTRRQSWHVRFFSVAAVAAYLLVLGPNTPVYEAAFHLVPGMQYFRFPTRFLFVVDCALVVLAAFGLDRIRALFRPGGSGARSTHTSVGVAELGVIGLVLADLLFFQMRQNPIVDATSWRTPPSTVGVLRADSSLYRIYSPGASDIHRETFRLAGGWQGDLRPFVAQREFLQPSSNILYDISSADGYAPLVPGYVVDIWGDQNRSGVIRSTARVDQQVMVPSAAFLKILSMFNVRYVLSAWPIRDGRLVPVDGRTYPYFYRNPSVLPRAWIVSNYRLAADSRAAQAVLRSDDFDPATEAILTLPPPAALERRQIHAAVTIERYAMSEVVIRTASDGNALLVLSDTYYPGWKAEVDGVEVPIMQANLSQRAVVVPGGAHTVRFVYESGAIRTGAVVSIASLLLVLVALVATGRRRSDALPVAPSRRT